MRHGFVLNVSLYLMMIVGLLVTIKYESIKNLQNIEEQAEIVYNRLQAERDVFDEILFNKYVFIEEDFQYMSKEYSFDVKNIGEDIEVNVQGREDYTIKLKYDDDCICFIEILYE